MRQIQTIALLTLIAIAHPISTFANIDVSTFRYQSTIQSSIQNQTYIAVPLDVNVIKNSTESGLRIVDKNGKETPYYLNKNSGDIGQQLLHPELTNTSTRGNITNTIVNLDTNTSVHDTIQIQTNSKNFKAIVKIFASDTQLSLSDTKWQKITDNGYIYN
ncbi:MAG: hypothetical protein WCO06_06285, partial [Candidatus Roizmanbacteria bacterium]